MYTLNNNDPYLRQLNRLLLEANQSQDLPEGKIFVDRSPNFASGVEITGRNTIIENQAYSDTYGDNCCGQIVGEGIEYVNYFEKVSNNTIKCNNAKLYQVGNASYFWVWDGYTRNQQVCVRKEILNIADDLITLDSDFDDIPYDRVKLIHGFATEPYTAGQGYITCKYANKLDPKLDYFLTDGPKQANECYGQHIEIDVIEDDKIFLKQPLFVDFDNPAIALVKPKKNIILNNIRFGVPLNTGSHSFLAVAAKNIELNSCESMYGPSAFGSVANSRIINNRGILALNNSTSNLIDGGVCYYLGFEEGCYNNSIRNIIIFNARGGQQGIYSNPYAPSGQFKLLNVVITNCGYNFGSGVGYPILGAFIDSVLENLSIINTQNNGLCVISGDNIIIRNSKFDQTLVVEKSRDIVLDSIKSPNIYCDPNTSGTIFNSKNITLNNGLVKLINSELLQGFNSINIERVGCARTEMSRYRECRN